MFKKLSILVIDDSKLINNSLSTSLKNRGFNITQAFSVDDAKNILKEQEFDYALLDLELPDGIGEDVLPYLQIHKAIRVIVLTSDTDKQRREHLFNFGIVIDYITKERYFADMELAIVQLIERVSTNKNLSILVVDDSNFMRKQLKTVLSKRGFKVYTAINGKEALEIIKSHKIDGSIIDLEMPIMDGNKLLSAIKRDKVNLLMPIMVISGTSNQDMIAKVIKKGASDFIKKPYANEELLLKVDKMMQELKQQRMLKVQENKFSMYNRAINEAAIFFKLDNKFNITYANKTLCDLLEIDIKTFENTPLENYIAKSNKDVVEYLKSQINLGKIFQTTLSLKNKESKNISLRLTFTALFDENNNIDEILAIGFDVSLLQQKEDELKFIVEEEIKKNWEQNKILIQQSKMAAMGEMIGHIGHQWRQPLNSLGVMFQKLNLAYKMDNLNETLMENSTDKAMRIISQMSKTIDDFRDFFKVDKKLVKCRISEVIIQSINIIEPTLKANDISIHVNTQNDRILKCLKNELSQVILNIISNAMDAIVLNKISCGEINISFGIKENNIIVTIDDNAGGIPENIIGKIFEPYFTTKEKTNGTGIGLYMSKTIIEEHMDGILRVNNTLSGASFQILLPIEL